MALSTKTIRLYCHHEQQKLQICILQVLKFNLEIDETDKTA